MVVKADSNIAVERRVGAGEKGVGRGRRILILWETEAANIVSSLQPEKQGIKHKQSRLSLNPSNPQPIFNRGSHRTSFSWDNIISPDAYRILSFHLLNQASYFGAEQKGAEGHEWTQLNLRKAHKWGWTPGPRPNPQWVMGPTSKA